MTQEQKLNEKLKHLQIRYEKARRAESNNELRLYASQNKVLKIHYEIRAIEKLIDAKL